MAFSTREASVYRNGGGLCKGDIGWIEELCACVR